METWTFEVAKQLVAKGNDVVIYAFKVRDHVNDEIVDGVRVVRYGPSSLCGLLAEQRTYPYLVRLLLFAIWLPMSLLQERDLDFAVVTYVSLSFAAPVLKLIRVPTWAVIHGFYEAGDALEMHGHVRGLIRVAVQALCLRMPIDGFIVVGERIKSTLIRRGIREDQIVVVRGGVDLRGVDAVQAHKSSDPLVCFMSRLIPERRLDELIHAIASASARVPKLRLVVVGDGPLRQECEALVLSLGLKERVTFTGFVYGESKIKILKQSHLLAHPSLREGMSLTIYEAFACGVPVVAYNIPEVREQIKLTGGGILVPPHDVKLLSQTIADLIVNHRLMDTLSSNGKAGIRSLAWESVANSILRLVDRADS